LHFKKHDIDDWIERQKAAALPAKACQKMAR
jgi:hypothetical protein